MLSGAHEQRVLADRWLSLIIFYRGQHGILARSGQAVGGWRAAYKPHRRTASSRRRAGPASRRQIRARRPEPRQVAPGTRVTVRTRTQMM